jgi:hypothetical protein
MHYFAYTGDLRDACELHPLDMADDREARRRARGTPSLRTLA